MTTSMIIDLKRGKKTKINSSKKSRNFFNVDLDLLASGNVSMKGKKKKKVYLIGFDPGFTKYVLRESIRFKLKNKQKVKTKVV